MARRSVMKLCLVVGGLVLIASLLFFLRNGPQMSRKRFEQVTIGMTREQVRQTVGNEPGDYSDGVSTLPSGLRYVGYEGWLCDDGHLLVKFDDQGIATDVVVLDVLDLHPTFS